MVTDSVECIQTLQKHIDKILEKEATNKSVAQQLSQLNSVFMSMSPDEKVVCLDWLVGRFVDCKINRER